MSDDGRRIDEVAIVEVVVVIKGVAEIGAVVTCLIGCRRDNPAPGSFLSMLATFPVTSLEGGTIHSRSRAGIVACSW